MCSSTLLPGSYTQGSDAGSLICIHHTTEPKSTDSSLSRQDAPAENQPKCSSQTVFSLSGIAISSVPLYSKRTESLDGPVCVTADMEAGERQGASTEGQDGESRDHAAGVKRKVKKPAPPPPPPSPHPHPEVTDRVVEETGKAGPATVPADDKVQQEATEPQQPSALVSPCVHPTEGGRQPAPVPRRKLSSFTAPVPAPRTKTAQTANNSSAAGKWALNTFTVVYFQSVTVSRLTRLSEETTMKLPFVVRSLPPVQARHLTNMHAHPGPVTCKCTETGRVYPA